MNSLRALRLTCPDSRLIAVLIFICAFALYARTAAPTLGGGHDSAEFQHVAYTLGIAHPTGYPLYLALGKIVTTFLPLGNIAYRMNLLSVLLGALGTMFVYLSASLVTRHRLAALGATAIFATNIAVWRQAGVASVSPLNLLLFAALMYTLLRWHLRRAGLLPVAFILGLGLAHHRSIILIAPAIVILLLLDDFNVLRRPREWVRPSVALAVPLLFYLYLPLFGNNSPWYSNTLEGFLAQVSAGEVGSYVRVTSSELLDALVTLAQFLFDSFGVLGWGIIALGILRFVPRFNRRAELARDARFAIFLGVATLTYVVWTIFFNSEQDRYFALPFFFLVYWFTLGIDTLSTSSNLPASIARLAAPLRLTLALVLVLMIALPFPARLRAVDWSRYDREYTLWNEVFSLPIPPRATLVGDWRQLNGMRYFQHIENRRTDLQLVGTMYDAAPQTDAAREAFADGRAIFIAPGLAQPVGEYRYAQLGPLLEVRDKPQMSAPASPKNISINSSLTLANFEITTALEPYAPTASIAPTRSARVTLDWRAEASVNNFLVRVKLYDPENRVIAQKDEPPVRGLYPATQWSPGEYVRDVHNIQIPGGTPPGKYSLALQVIDTASKQNIGDEIALSSFAVERATNLTREQVFIARPLDRALNDQLVLWGYGGFGGAHRAGEGINGNLIFFAGENIGKDVTLQFALIDPSGKTIEAWQRAPINFYPTRDWRRGEILKAYYDFQLPKNLSSGEYSFVVDIGQLFIALDKFQITP